MEQIIIKRGDTFDFSCILTDDAGTPLSGKALNIKCEIRDVEKTLLKSFTITESDTPGTYLFRSGTADWQKRQAYMDIQYTEDGIIVSSETILIVLREDVTQ
ncbi:hypothetical protein [Bacteroides sp.]|uniref:hypothetical protein n=1 Tax=Bacteroides sp. TaxID=29523 RepID=UPI002633C031|nr:hypothetical protein [Bacteroides sp.]MDD3039750.1 hypothetical protein [Bacteroides sp.]